MWDSMKIGGQLLAVGIGGMLGAMGRYTVSLLFTSSTDFPFATLTVNLIGCFFLSYLLNNKQVKSRLKPEAFIALSTGLIGSFTTFSTFAVETIELMTRNFFLAAFYVVLSVIGGLGLCYLGFKVAYRRHQN